MIGKAVLFPVTSPFKKNLLYSYETVPLKSYSLVFNMYVYILTVMNMLSFESSKGFQDKCNCLESLKTTRVRKTTRIWKTTRFQKTTRVWKTARSIENHKTMMNLRDQEVRKPARVRKSTRVKEGCQVSRNQNLKSLED
jgi:hypothetical protein